MLRALANRLLHPFPRFPFLPAHLFCPADAVAERIARDGVEHVTASHPQGRVIATAFNRFLDDPGADRALRKEYHHVWENRLRAVAIHLEPPGEYGFDPLNSGPLAHPLDAWAVAELKKAGCAGSVKPQGGWSQCLRHHATVWAGAAIFATAAITLPLFKGAARVEPKRWRVAGPNFWMVDTWQGLLQAAREKGLDCPDPMGFVLEEKRLAPDYRASGLAVIEPEALLVPRREWLRRVLLPGLRLLGIVLWASLRAGGDARVVELAARTMNLAARSLNIWRLGFNLRGQWYTDISDSSSFHNLRAVILRKFGFKLVRWPYAQLETPGIGLSYLDYDAYLSPGPYQARHCADSWSPRCRAVSVGQVRIDRHLIGGEKVAPIVDEAVEALRRQGLRVAAYFGNNMGVGFERPMMDLLAVVAEEVLKRPGWALVVKPKGTDRFYRRAEAEGRFAFLDGHPRVVTVRYPREYSEVCPAGWLIERTDCGFGLPGSIQQESLSMGKPLLTYYPIHQDTVFRRRMIESGLMFSDLNRLRTAVAQVLDQPQSVDCQQDWIHENFDPFGDHEALSRIAELFFTPEGGTSHA